MRKKLSSTASADEYFMRLALEEARIGDRTPGAGEVGCVIVRDGEVAALGHNEVEMRNDPTAHAEVVTLRKLGEKWKTIDLSGCTLYSTLQPCGMCTMAAIWSRIGRIVYGATRSDVHSMYFEERHYNTADFIHDAFKADIEMTAGVLAAECSQLYYTPGELPGDARDDPAGAKPEEETPVVGGIVETALYVTDLDRSEQFYTRLFGFERMYAEQDRMRALAIPSHQVLLLFRAGASVKGASGGIPGHDGRGNLHVAFSIPREQVESWELRLAASGIPLESKVKCRDGVSLYFRDPDRHLIELITPGCWRNY